MASLGKRLKWQGQKILRALAWPGKALKEFRRLYRTMGPKGVFWYMALQGRWHFGVTLALSLATLPLLYAGLMGAVQVKGTLLSWLGLLPLLAIVAFFNYVLLRATSHLRNKKWLYMTRLYVSPILVLCAVMALAAVLQLVIGLIKLV